MSKYPGFDMIESVEISVDDDAVQTRVTYAKDKFTPERRATLSQQLFQHMHEFMQNKGSIPVTLTGPNGEILRADHACLGSRVIGIDKDGSVSMIIESINEPAGMSLLRKFYPDATDNGDGTATINVTTGGQLPIQTRYLDVSFPVVEKY